ncbi:hypothetical protein M0804_004592 [Polistes exclamans]|nr:hypothetical protein M0804_004592 [Polistes exclamans]
MRWHHRENDDYDDVDYDEDDEDEDSEATSSWLIIVFAHTFSDTQTLREACSLPKNPSNDSSTFGINPLTNDWNVLCNVNSE